MYVFCHRFVGPRRDYFLVIASSTYMYVFCHCLKGHVETIFDCKFKPDNPDLLATASFDGTIKVWNINSWTAVDSSPGNEGIIYSISWAPGEHYPD